MMFLTPKQICFLAFLGVAGCVSSEDSKSRVQAYRQHWETVLAEKRTLDQVLPPKALAYLQDLATNKFQCALTKEYLATRINFFMVPANFMEDMGPMSDRPVAGVLVPAHQELSKKGRILKEIAFGSPDGQARDFAIFISLKRSRNDALLIEGVALHELIHLAKIRSGAPFRDQTQMTFEEYKREEREIFYYTYNYMKNFQGWELEELMEKIEGYGWRMKVPPRWLEFYREVWEAVPSLGSLPGQEKD